MDFSGFPGRAWAPPRVRDPHTHSRQKTAMGVSPGNRDGAEHVVRDVPDFSMGNSIK